VERRRPEIYYLAPLRKRKAVARLDQEPDTGAISFAPMAGPISSVHREIFRISGDLVLPSPVAGV
jgi:hypothetical protein